ncbi:MAG: DUF885 domain-containing protein, partial [Cellvibrionaceae bacterium]|nr:DUF885 domain-containing protein [Cellvibrionaceae bacterium]
MKLASKASRWGLALASLAASQLSLAAETKPIAEFFEQSFQQSLANKPMYLTYLGMKEKYDQWGDFSEAEELRDIELSRRQLAQLKAYDFDKLSPQQQLSYRLFEKNVQEEELDYQYRLYDYPVNQMHGIQSSLPAFLINMHGVESEADARAYISRLQKVKPLFAQVIERMQASEAKGIMPPKFVFPMVIKDSQNIIGGKPFDAKADKDNALWADIKKKITGLALEQQQSQALMAEAEAALTGDFQAAYKNLIAFLQQQQQRADSRDGVWKFPGGEEFYKYRLAKMTTTDMSADEIHKLGLAEVARIHKEMVAIKEQVKFNGDLAAFFKFMRNDPQFKLPNTDAGRQQYLDRAVEVIDDMKTRLDSLFITKPKADLAVTRVEAFREDSAGRAFYQRPSLDGKRPGRYYVNLADMNEMATYELEALAYHEG